MARLTDSRPSHYCETTNGLKEFGHAGRLHYYSVCAVQVSFKNISCSQKMASAAGFLLYEKTVNSLIVYVL